MLMHQIQPTFDRYVDRLPTNRIQLYNSAFDAYTASSSMQNAMSSLSCSDANNLYSSLGQGHGQSSSLFDFLPSTTSSSSCGTTSIADVLMADQDPLDCFGSFADNSSNLLSVLPDIMTSSSVSTSSSASMSSSLHGIDVINSGVQSSYMMHKDDFGLGLDLDLGLGGVSNAGHNSTTSSSSIFQFPDLPISSLFNANAQPSQSLYMGHSSNKMSLSATDSLMTSSSMMTPASLASSASDSFDFASSIDSTMAPRTQMSYTAVVTAVPAMTSSLGLPNYGSPHGSGCSYFDAPISQPQMPVMDDFPALATSAASYKPTIDPLTINRRRLFAEHRPVSELTLPQTCSGDLKFHAPLSTTPPTPLTPQSAPPYGSDVVGGRQLQQQTSLKIGDGLLCAVCGDNAVCQHYGVRTCEGCKGFFKRTVQKNSKYVCLGDKQCPIDKRRRNRCQFCRFQKCLSVGMVKEVVRTDSLKGRRGRLPTKPKSQQESPPSPPASLITVLVRAQVDTWPDIPTLDYSSCHIPSMDASLTKEDVRSFYSILSSSVDVIKAWAEKLPGFTDLCPEDQQLLLNSSMLELISLRLASSIQTNDDRIIFCNGQVYHRLQCALTMGDWVDAIVDFGLGLQKMGVDLSSASCMAALVLITQRHGLKDSQKVENMQMKIIDALRDHCTYNSEAQKKPQLLSRILGRIPELRSLSSLATRRLDLLRATVSPPTSLSTLV